MKKYGLGIRENRVNVLVIENSDVLVDVVQDLYAQKEGREGGLVLAEEEKIYPFQKNVSVILEPFSLNMNERKIQTQLYQEIKEEAYGGAFTETLAIQKELMQYLDRILFRVPYLVTYTEEFDLNGFLKWMKVSLENEAESFLEKIVQYLRILSALCRVRVVFFLQLKAFLKEEELRELYKEAAYCKIQLVLIESVMRDKIEMEDICIIDRDMCIIQV